MYIAAPLMITDCTEVRHHHQIAPVQSNDSNHSRRDIRQRRRSSSFLHDSDSTVDSYSGNHDGSHDGGRRGHNRRSQSPVRPSRSRSPRRASDTKSTLDVMRLGKSFREEFRQCGDAHLNDTEAVVSSTHKRNSNHRRMSFVSKKATIQSSKSERRSPRRGFQYEQTTNGTGLDGAASFRSLPGNTDVATSTASDKGLYKASGASQRSIYTTKSDTTIVIEARKRMGKTSPLRRSSVSKQQRRTTETEIKKETTRTRARKEHTMTKRTKTTKTNRETAATTPTNTRDNDEGGMLLEDFPNRSR